MASSNPHSPATQVGRRAVAQPTVSFHTSPCHRDPRPGASVPGWARLPVVDRPGCLAHSSVCIPLSGRNQLFPAVQVKWGRTFQSWGGLAWGCSYTRVRAPGWGDREGPARATREFVLHVYTNAHGYCSLCPRWALHLYTFFLFCGSLFLPG